MPIVLNSNSATTEASFTLGKANNNLRQSISRHLSGNRITRQTDDASGLAVAYQLKSSFKRTETALKNQQNALPFIQAQDGMLEAIGQIVDRMAGLRTLTADVSKNAADVENYSKEFIELQEQLHQMKREKFNGVDKTQTLKEENFIKRFDPDGDNTITGSQWYVSWFDCDDDEQPDDSEVVLVMNSYAASGIEADVVTGHGLHQARPEFCKLASQCSDGGSCKPDDRSRSNPTQTMRHSLNSLTNQPLLTITQFTNHISKDAEK